MCAAHTPLGSENAHSAQAAVSRGSSRPAGAGPTVMVSSVAGPGTGVLVGAARSSAMPAWVRLRLPCSIRPATYVV